MRALPGILVVCISGVALAEPPAAEPLMSLSGSYGTSGRALDVLIGAGQAGTFAVAVDAGFRDSNVDMAKTSLDLHVAMGPWIEAGRFHLLASGELGAIDRFAPYQILDVKSIGWTASAGARVDLWWRYGRTGFQQPEWRVVDAAIGVTGSAFVTYDREAVALVSLTIALWRTSRLR